MAGLSAQISTLDSTITAILQQIESLTVMQSTPEETPEVLSFSIGGKDTQFVGPDRLANAITKLTDSWIKLSERRDALQSRLSRINAGGRIRRTGVSPC